VRDEEAAGAATGAAPEGTLGPLTYSPCRDPMPAAAYNKLTDLNIIDIHRWVMLISGHGNPTFQPTISHHLRLLREAGLIGTEKQGIWAYYGVTELGRRCLDAMLMLG